jgi:predicted transcriptional regulator
MSGQPEEGAGSLFFELAGDLRLSMLMKLSQKQYRLSQIAIELDATLQEAHRNILRLTDSGLVSKDSEGELILTPYGKIIVSLIPSYDFLFDQRTYFLEHSLDKLPLKFIQRIGALHNCEVVHGVMAILQRWKTLYNNSDKYIKEIMSQVPLDLIETIGSRVQNGVKFSYIFSSNAIIPKGRSQILHRIGWRNLISKGLVERRMLNEVQIMTIFNEEQSCLMFPNLKGEPDLNVMFYSEDVEFHYWCEDFYEYMWGEAEAFDEAKLKPEV